LVITDKGKYNKGERQIIIKESMSIFNLDHPSLSFNTLFRMDSDFFI
jgi:hypothetical protein